MKTQDADTKAFIAELEQDVVAKGLRDGSCHSKSRFSTFDAKVGLDSAFSTSLLQNLLYSMKGVSEATRIMTMFVLY